MRGKNNNKIMKSDAKKKHKANISQLIATAVAAATSGKKCRQTPMKLLQTVAE